MRVRARLRLRTRDDFDLNHVQASHTPLRSLTSLRAGQLTKIEVSVNAATGTLNTVCHSLHCCRMSFACTRVVWRSLLIGTARSS